MSCRSGSAGIYGEWNWDEWSTVADVATGECATVVKESEAKWKARCATEYHETLWKPVLDSMEPWGEFVRARTHDTVSRICIALVPFAHTGDERVPELYAMDHLAHRAGGRRGPSAGVSCV